ncbi:MAG TPA: AbrB/MazE/SpoVT family DNA-binding domain-containing protein, partial [Acholeplasmataceae bacterium]|nr:AbrB/MazE/SpoVT family DNA-binding domain-containing protein [Acholeplasmataceae bacterium]
GQIVIPKQAREIFDIKPGDNLIILADVEKGMAIPPKSQVSTILNNILGDEK